MKAIKSLLALSVLVAAGTANAAIIATYDFANAGQITGLLTGQIDETGTAILDDVGGGQGVMTIDIGGTTNIFGDLSITTSRIVFQGTLSDGVFTIVSGQSANLTCSTPAGSTFGCPTGPSLPTDPNDPNTIQWTSLTATPLTGDGGGLPITVTSSGIVYDNLFVVADATNPILTRVWSYDHVLSTRNKMTFTNTTVPVPAAAWLFGSGLLGLTGIVRRRKAA